MSDGKESLSVRTQDPAKWYAHQVWHHGSRLNHHRVQLQASLISPPVSIQFQNMGQKPIPARNNGVKFDSTWQVAEVSKPLGAVIAMVKKGNRVVFDRIRNA